MQETYFLAVHFLLGLGVGQPGHPVALLLKQECQGGLRARVPGQ